MVNVGWIILDPQDFVLSVIAMNAVKVFNIAVVLSSMNS